EHRDLSTVTPVQQSWNRVCADWLLYRIVRPESMVSQDRPTSCPLCGDVCHCTSATQPGVSRSPLRSREEQFAASVEPAIPVRQRFVLDRNEAARDSRLARSITDRPGLSAEETTSRDREPAPAAPPPSNIDRKADDELQIPGSPGDDFSLAPAHNLGDPTAWKREVAARLDSYRARRKPKPPRYPSMRLKFEPAEDPVGASYEAASNPRTRRGVLSGDQGSSHASSALAPANATPAVEHSRPPSNEAARIIEFPRWYEPPTRSDELAEPVFDRPRILEAPEIVPPPPALGGIILEPEEKEPERRPGFELPLQSAPGKKRVQATLIDALIVLS